MQRILCFVIMSLSSACPKVTAQNVDYVPVNQLRQNYTRAQDVYLSMHPELESHLFHRPKQQVLKEIDETADAAKRFTEAQRRYFQGRKEEYDRQLGLLNERRTGRTAPAR